MSKNDWVRICLIGLAAVAAAAFISVVTGQSLTIPDNHPATTPGPNYSGWTWPTPDSSGRMVLNNLVTYTPPADAAPKYTADEALERATRAGWGNGEAQVTLRVATFLEQFKNRLAWLIEYANDTMMVGGPPGLSSKDRAAMENSGVCEFFVVMDASVDSGTYRYDKRYNVLTAGQVCWPKGANLVGGYGGAL